MSERTGETTTSGFPASRLTLARLRLAAFTPTEQAAELERYSQAEQEAGFNLTQPPLCQATVILLSEECCRFVWSNHHLLMDGWSLPILLREAIYEL
ncbi:MAG: condensation domain-containing protein [Chloroflexi bacterium]|nr:condensation domain-containing protein [Chloroflexota bacterium]